MKNVKTIFNLTVLGLSFGLLTACGGGSSSSPAPVVTTLPNCTSASLYNTQTQKWTLSNTDSRECKAITTVPQNVVCAANKVKVRIPVTSQNTNTALPTNTPLINHGTGQQTCVQQSNGQIVCGTATNSNLHVNQNTNYHTVVGSYKDTCLDHNSPEWQYIVHAGTYYYLDYNLAYSHYQNYQYQYQYHYNKQLSPKETIITFGVLAAALFFLTK